MRTFAFPCRCPCTHRHTQHRNIYVHVASPNLCDYRDPGAPGGVWGVGTRRGCDAIVGQGIPRIDAWMDMHAHAHTCTNSGSAEIPRCAHLFLGVENKKTMFYKDLSGFCRGIRPHLGLVK